MHSEMERKKEEIIKKYGPWTAHNINLADNLYTMGEKFNYDTLKLRRVLQIISDITRGQFNSLKILDLGSLEGLYAIELGLKNVKKAVGIEGREANLKKSEFSKDTLNINNIQFFQDDVRNISEQKYGKFDLILCLGLLYHLDMPDGFYLLEKMYSMCERFTVIDTHIALRNDRKISYKSKTYFGSSVREFKKNLPPEKKATSPWNALDNEKSFLFSKKSLLRFLGEAGFSSVYECHVPFEYVKPKDRLTLLAIKGKRVRLHTYPHLGNLKEHNIKQIILKSEKKKINPVSMIKRMFKIIKELLKIITRRYYKENQ